MPHTIHPVRSDDPLAQERMLLQLERDAHARGFWAGLIIGAASILFAVLLLIAAVRLLQALIL